MEYINDEAKRVIEQKLKQGKRIEMEYNHQTDELIRWLCRKCVDSIINVCYNVFESWGYVIGGNIWKRH